jgi:hypothetical protein
MDEQLNGESGRYFAKVRNDMYVVHRHRRNALSQIIEALNSAEVAVAFSNK